MKKEDGDWYDELSQAQIWALIIVVYCQMNIWAPDEPFVCRPGNDIPKIKRL